MTMMLLERPRTAATTLEDALTRRGFLAGGVGVGALLALPACSAPAATPTAARTRQVSTVNGPVEVPEQALRVVTLDSFTMGAAFDLGRTPVGVYSAGEQYVEPQFVEKWRPITKISKGTVGGSIDLEKVATLKPDLILGIDGSKPPYEQLKQIAPTVILPFNASKVPWRDMSNASADALGLGNALSSLQQRYADRTAAIKRDHADVLARTHWNIIQGGFDQGQFWVYGPKSPIGGILADAGVQFATASKKAVQQQTVSYELIEDLRDADAIFYYSTNADKPANLGSELFSQTAFTKLAATTAGHLYGSVYFLPNCYSDALGALDALEKALTALK
ncbi:ABC transporter substrate-binding protein [Amycolatopsis rhabdoformis]|uniref:ABC transporter substrate-binding protein n=1 Tax=Amycolatopsis rhabdoformis TaxID=1448059 RepID=A0ABZ1HZF8_9PSEU|nr:ABC transporter substrate-binding protein [Amycolatopsis rhabdoformis]WSE26891.1 ABC transporter substrate-binding protein [Amycolatopsis rhabdoformis]